ncbi:ribose 5-phosphate isomerase B [uncultured Selenomonas sp.]|jgi:ribose-5-phosphate isomerase B|uniref:ribose 5-phosphate isomerase B n=1 Tax=uncultured Selenomonas sp. TaxID=159275 RepID=UPI001CB13254|nr:ribose 5-phosphate isomerase B [uncultured Selenomonas sp.]MBF1686562.1 ribose 5-phosphate isomerase B [Selenomonas sp.]MBF1686935.1 ribose 5-phosphate isomerase B [Selenomonas sp.]MBF1696933.1 ribose 5-phosphate isomerase B [Selenomonas sp.]MBF1714651.1 ribose 5-phosphate isomerase B [Selenomonas sp.]
MKITIGSDHGAVELKEEVKMVLHEFEDVRVTDVGTFGTESVDYPDIAEKVCADVVSGKADRGIVLCGTGIGISIAANKIDGIRAALCGDVYSAIMSRKHNDANVLAMGGRVTGIGPAGEIVRAWVCTEFEGGRHARRVDKIMALEQKKDS